MKKYLSLFLCLMLLLLVIPSVAAAGTDDAFSIVCEDVYGVSGDEVVVFVEIKNNPGIAYLALTPQYSSSDLQLVGVENGSLFPDFTKGSKQYIWATGASGAEGDTANVENVTSDGTLMFFRFKIAENALEGKYSVSFIVRECYDADTQPVAAPVVKSGSVTVSKYPQGTCGDNLTWKIDANGTLTISGTGKMYDFDLSSDWGRKYSSLINKVVIEEGVTTIGSRAFTGCDNLTSVSIPASVTAIEGDAFMSCPALRDIQVNANNQNYWVDSNGVLLGLTYGNCSVIKMPSTWSGSYTIPDSVVWINDSAFDGCTGLTAVTIPNSVTRIFSGAFAGCTNLKSVVIPESVTDVGPWALMNVETVIVLGMNTEFSSEMAINTSAVIEGHNGSAAQTYAAEHGNKFRVLTRITGASLVLESNLAISYQVNKALFEEYGFTNPRLEVVMNGVKTTITDYYTSGEKYVFVFRNIAPNKMNDTATATFYATFNGTEYVSSARDYGIFTYCYNMLGQEQSAKFRTLLVDLLNYGAASQIYTNYRTDALVNAALTETQKSWGTSQDPVLENALNTKYVELSAPTAKWRGAALYLQDAVTIQLKLEAADLTDLYVKVTNDKNQTWTIPASQFESLGNNQYFAYFSGLDAGQMRDYVYLTIYKGNTPISHTARYSICSYAFSKQNDTSVPGLAGLVKAMMKYGDAAYAFAN